MSLQDLFNSPIAAPPRSPRAATPETPTRDAVQPLFFSPGSAAGTPLRPAAPTPAAAGPSRPGSVPAPDLFNLFDEDDRELFPPVPPALGSSRPANTVRQDDGMFRGYTQAGGDFAPLIDPFAGVRDVGMGNNDGEGEGKKRRVMAKVDADRLMEANGLPALMQKAKRFKVKGKGREVEDLANLMDVYQMWAHKMFPKGDFAQTIQRVEVMCRGRRMNSALKGYREAFYPPRKSPTPLARTPSPVRSEEDDAEARDTRRSSPTTRRSSQPAADEQDGDMDAEEAMEMLRQQEEDEAGTRKGQSEGGGERRAAEPLFTPGEPDDEELAALLEMDDM